MSSPLRPTFRGEDGRSYGVVGRADADPAQARTCWPRGPHLTGGHGECGRQPSPVTPCSVPNCPRGHYARGLCSAHYQHQRAGIPLDSAPTGSLNRGSERVAGRPKQAR